MKAAKFIFYPDFDVDARPQRRNPAHRERNNRDQELLPGGGTVAFAKRFTIDGKILSASLRITSLGIFEAFVNGRRVSADGVSDELMPLWTDYNYRVFECEYDILPIIKKKGENIFTARVSDGWWRGRISYGAYSFRPTALCAEIELVYADGRTELIPSGEDWSVSFGGPLRTADLWDGEYFDARIPDPCLLPDKADWRPAALFTDYKCEIIPFEGEPVRVDEYIAPISAVVWRGTKKNGFEYGEIKTVTRTVGDDCEAIRLRRGQHIILDFGADIVGRPSIAVNAADGTRIDLLFAEMLNDSGDPQRGNDGPAGSLYLANYRSALSRVVYIAASSSSRKQLNIFKPRNTYYGFRYIELFADRDIEIECITAETLSANLVQLGEFTCSDAEVNKLYSNIVRGMKGNYLAVPTDCPQRDEKLGWSGDTQVFAGAASYIADTRAFLRRWLVDARNSQKKFGGAYADVIPRVFAAHNGSAAWADAGLIVPMKLYEMFGDLTVVEENYEAMEDYMTYLEQFGLEGPNTTYGDWLCYEVTDKRYIAVCYYALDASLMQKFSELLGKDDRAEYYAELRKKIVAHFHEKYVSGGEITEKTQTAYILPLAFDMIEGELRESTIKALEKKIIDNGYRLSTGFVGTSLLNTTLSKVGLTSLAYSLLLQGENPSWLYSVRQGATTVWERWNSYTAEEGFGLKAMNSFNHYSYGAVAEWLYATVAGIRPDPDAPGFEESFILSPCPDLRTDAELPQGQKPITMASAVYRGILSRWEYENGLFVWQIVIPDGKARVEFPLIYGQKKLNINGIDFNARELGGEIVGDRLIFTLTAGKYTLK